MSSHFISSSAIMSLRPLLTLLTIMSLRPLLTMLTSFNGVLLTSFCGLLMSFRGVMLTSLNGVLTSAFCLDGQISMSSAQGARDVSSCRNNKRQFINITKSQFVIHVWLVLVCNLPILFLDIQTLLTFTQIVNHLFPSVPFSVRLNSFTYPSNIATNATLTIFLKFVENISFSIQL